MRFLGVLQATSRGNSELADKNYELLKADPDHPSLQFKKVGPIVRCESVSLTALSELRTGIRLFGFGLETMMNMNA